ncbi:MAG: serine/threonine protein kinase [Candidatus Eremiobacteraeota bacterium]|nr:serine/threonine protein kinase [Candidatus Eremiobacteraeota bacterium]
MENDPLLGRVIDGKYRIDAEIGAGGMATIYRAARLHIEDVVAIKVLHSELLREPHFADRFRREAQAAARLKHPNVVAIHDFGVTGDGVIYLVMELVEGRNLRAVIRERGPLPAAFAAEIVRQVCAALTEAHRRGIVHRDLKPANIAVEDSLDGPRVKVLDFGIASLATGQTIANLTQTGTLLGTPAYMSPEQCMGEELDARSDVYSGGVVLFEMLCGVVPFNSPTPTAVVMQHVQQAPPALRVLNASVPPAVEDVVLRALAKRREDRFQTAHDLADALTAATRGSPLSPSAESLAAPRLAPQLGPTMMQPAWRAASASQEPSGARSGRTAGFAIGLGAALALALVLFGVQRFLSPREPSRAAAQLTPAPATAAPARAEARPAVRAPPPLDVQQSTAAVVQTYYGLWDAHRLPEAYALLSRRYQAEHPYPSWSASHSSVVHISVQTTPTNDPMTVTVVVRSLDRTPYGTAGSEYQGTWRAVSEDGVTRLDQVALDRTR